MARQQESYGVAKVCGYLPTFARYVFQNIPAAKWAVIIAVLGVMLEYATLSVMLPLASGENGKSSGLAGQVIFIWYKIVNALGLPREPRTWLWLFLLLLGIRIAVGFAQLTLNTWVSKRILSFLSGGTFSRVIRHEPLVEIYRRTVGYYTSLAGDESVRVGQVFFHLAQTVSALIAAAIGMAALYIFSITIFKLTVLFLLLAALFLGVSMKYVFAWSSESAMLSREANTTFIEAFNGIRSIRSMAGEDFVVDRYGQYIKRYGLVLFFLDTFNHGSRSVPGLILILLGLIVLFPGAGMLEDFSTVYFFTVTTMLIRILSFLGTAVASGGRAMIDIRAAFDISEIMGEAQIHSLQKFAGKEVPPTVRNITLSNISCGYSTGEPVLKNVTAEMQAGKIYALVGSSGSGKSTLSDVLLGLLLPMSGEIKVCGHSYYGLNMSKLRKSIVLVEQQPRIFSGSIRENLAFGINPTETELQSAVMVAGLSEFINSLPQGLETRLDYQGANISGGQRQRIGLARAIVRQPDVLILDEATSALDSQTRDIVIRNLISLFKDRILLFITHDNHVIAQADEVWHIKKHTLAVEQKNSL